MLSPTVNQSVQTKTAVDGRATAKTKSRRAATNRKCLSALPSRGANRESLINTIMEHPRNSQLLGFAKKLRKDMTKEERHLWYDFLSSYPVRFRRQEIIDCFIVDFYCSKARLAVELDGSQHYEDKSIKYDEERTKKLKSLGVEVIRFSNSDVLQRFEGVCIRIDEAVRFRLNHPSVSYADSSPQGEP